MAKLSHKITNNNSGNNNYNNNSNKKVGFTLSTKVDTNQENTQKNQKEEQNIVVDTELVKLPISISQIITQIGLNNFGTLTKADFETFFPPEVEVDVEDIKKKIINKVLKEKIATIVEEKAKEINQKYAELLNKLSEAEEKLNKQNIHIKNLTMQVEDGEEQLYKTEKKYSDTVPVDDLIEKFIRGQFSNQYTQKISELLKEGFKNGGKNGSDFTFGFLKGFVYVEEAIINLGSNEKENLDLLLNSGKNLLSASDNLFNSSAYF